MHVKPVDLKNVQADSAGRCGVRDRRWVDGLRPAAGFEGRLGRSVVARRVQINMYLWPHLDWSVHQL